MQELRLVLIIVGALAIAMLLFHGLWTNRKEQAVKFGNKNAHLDHSLDEVVAPEDDFEIIKKTRKNSNSSREHVTSGFESNLQVNESLNGNVKIQMHNDPIIDDVDMPKISALDGSQDIMEPSIHEYSHRQHEYQEPLTQSVQPLQHSIESDYQLMSEPVIEPEEEEHFEVLSLHVHSASGQIFNGRALFNSMQQNGLQYGEMSIYHRYADLSGTGKVFFSVANIMQPGSLSCDDIDSFTTLGISFFMTLPCYGEADQNFKLMLRTAQQIADDLNGHVLDDQRNLMTANRIAMYRRQIQQFIQAQRERTYS